jgi:hypothetical protein
MLVRLGTLVTDAGSVKALSKLQARARNAGAASVH